MLHVDGLNTRGNVTSQKVASQKVIIGVAHFVSQKETKRMAMHVYDMLTIHRAYYVWNKNIVLKRKTSPVANESVLR